MLRENSRPHNLFGEALISHSIGKKYPFVLVDHDGVDSGSLSH